MNYIKSLGCTAIRIPLNYRHFENDADPYHYLEDGFKRLDQTLRWCEEAGLYVILDLHAVPGWQNNHWHSDNDTRHSPFWRETYYQDRFVALWKEFARRYRSRAVIAGYDVMNEPCVNNPQGDFPWNIVNKYRPEWARINHIYQRVVYAIREIDANHIIFLEGDQYARRFQGLSEPFSDNLVYSSHNYTAAGFGPGSYPGHIHSARHEETPSGQWDSARQQSHFLGHEGTVYTQKAPRTPVGRRIWVSI